MRVVHLSYHEISGGAARAAHGLHTALLSGGVDSRMLVVHKQTTDPRVETIGRNDPKACALNLVEERWIARHRTQMSNTLFSTGAPGERPAQHPSVIDADVIQLHWIPRLASPRDIGELLALGKPVVWTLHDEWAYTGGCHYATGCERWRTTCTACPQLTSDPHRLVDGIFASKQLSLCGGNLTIVAPSRWLAQRARASTLLSSRRVECIPYGVDLDTFTPVLREQGRRMLAVEPNEAVVLFSADAASEKRKGFVELQRALSLLPDNLPSGVRMPRVAVVGSTRGVPIPRGAIAPGYVADRRTLASLVAASDLYVLPSLEDNLPNGVLEALACGTPCIGFETGGVPDMLADAPASVMVPVGDADALAAAVAVAVTNLQRLRQSRCDIRAYAEKRFAPSTQAGGYINLYGSLHARRSSEFTANSTITQGDEPLEALRVRVAQLEAERTLFRTQLSPLREWLWKAASHGIRVLDQVGSRVSL